MGSKIDMVVFDMAGTTVNDEGNVTAAFASAMAAHGYEVPPENINPLMGYKKPVAIKMMLAKFEPNAALITDALIDRIHNRFVENMIQFYTTTTNLYPLPHVEEVFAALRAKQIKVCLNTGFSRDIADVIIDRLQWWPKQLIDDVVASDEVQEGRPAPFMIHSLMQRAGIADAARVVKVGDTEVDINEGKNTGCVATIGITTGAFTKQGLATYGPNFIIDDMSELLAIVDGINANGSGIA
ncbi:MAG: HAD family hydrolase [Bacteroidetes bacterium]|nr:MAG: HAD family hydrolase [Bacteroidota bacterium]